MIDTNKIYNENCLSTMAKMPDSFVDLTFTSPPYNMRTRVRNGEYTVRERSEHFSKKYKYFDDALSISDYYEFHHKVISELLRVSNMIIWNVQIVTGSKEAIFKLIGDFNTNIKDIIIWDKNWGQPSMHENCINRGTEYLIIFEKNASAGRTLKRAFFERGTMSDIWRVGKNVNTHGGKNHQATFPIKLVEKALAGFSKEGDLIYDPFMGTGTTAVASKNMDRNFIGSEISEEYCDICNERLENIKSKNKLF